MVSPYKEPANKEVFRLTGSTLIYDRYNHCAYTKKYLYTHIHIYIYRYVYTEMYTYIDRYIYGQPPRTLILMQPLPKEPHLQINVDLGPEPP